MFRSPYTWTALVVVLVALQGVKLYVLGQPLICECGYLKVWEGIVLSSGNSQHLTDWYTPSHVIHGILFYLGLWFLFPRTPVLFRLFVAAGIEVAWELLENSPWIIERYREQALAQGYVGDSIINSLSDTLAAIIGFLIAWRLPILISIGLVLALELFVGYMIHDNLLLNIIQLIHPIDATGEWQAS